MKRIGVMVFLSLLAHAVAAPEDAVLQPGESVTIVNKVGTLEVRAEANLKRVFTWNGESRWVVMWERTKPWYGSKSIYYPGPGQHWRENKGVTRGVIEEGKREFADAVEFKKWLHHEYQAFLDFQYLGPGRIGGWCITLARRQLHSVIWEIRIDGELLSEKDFNLARVEDL